MGDSDSEDGDTTPVTKRRKVEKPKAETAAPVIVSSPKKANYTKKVQVVEAVSDPSGDESESGSVEGSENGSASAEGSVGSEESGSLSDAETSSEKDENLRIPIGGKK